MADEPSNIGPPIPSCGDGLPPLRLHHFFAWTAVSAALLGVISQFDNGFARVAPWWIVSWLAGILLATMALTCCGYGLQWRRRGLPFPSQPGHGLLLACATSFLMSIGFSLLFAILIRGGTDAMGGLSPWLTRLLTWNQHAEIVVLVGLNLWCAWRFRSARRWQVFFVLNALVAGNLYVQPLLKAALIEPISNLEWIGPGLATAVGFITTRLARWIPAAAIVVAIVRDRREGIPRHWSHWAGVATFFAFVPSEIMTALISVGWLPMPVPLK